jgi:hypothetical protein
MEKTITRQTDAAALVLAQAIPLDRHPALVYLAGLSDSGRRTMRQGLDTMAGLLTGEVDALVCNYAAL